MVQGTQTILDRIAAHIQNNELLYLSPGTDNTTIQLTTDDIVSPVNVDITNRNKTDTGSGSRIGNFFKKEWKLVATEPSNLPVQLKSLAIAKTLGTLNLEVDFANDPTGWTGTGDAVATGTGTPAIQGNFSLKMGKTDTNVTAFGYYKVVTSRNATGKRLVISFRSPDESALDSTKALQVKYGAATGTGGTDYFFKNFSRQNLIDGKNRDDWFVTSMDVGTGDMTAVGSPDITDMDYIEINGFTNLAADTVTLGDFNFDDLKLVEDETEEALLAFLYPVPLTKDNLGEFLIRVTGSVVERQ